MGKGARDASSRIRAGFVVFVFVLAALLLAAWNTGFNLLYILLGQTASFLALGVVVPWFSLRGLRLKREAPATVTRGEPFLVALRIENPKRFVSALSVCIERPTTPLERMTAAGRWFWQRGPREILLGAVARVPAQRAAVLDVYERIERRGVHRLPGYTLYSGFPFGLLEWRIRHQDDLEIVVHPRARSVRTAFVDRMEGPNVPLRAASSDGDEFYGLRDYQPGDELRKVAWRVSARLGKWIVRENSVSAVRNVTIALDTRFLPDIPDFIELFEETVEAAASLGVSLLRRGFDVSLIAPSGAVESGKGSTQERRLLDALARVSPVLADECPAFDVLAARFAAAQQAKLICLSPDPAAWDGPGLAGKGLTISPRLAANA